MGFYSTFVTNDFAIEWPDWFVERHHERVVITKRNDGRYMGVISSRDKWKVYGKPFEALLADIQRVLNEREPLSIPFVLLALHECGGVMRVQFDQHGMHVTEWWEGAWVLLAGPGHTLHDDAHCGHCCTDAGKAEEPPAGA